MKISYRANNEYGTEFDDPISCQIYEKALAFLEAHEEGSDWYCLYDLKSGFEGAPHTLKELVKHRHLFKQLMDQFTKFEAEL